MQKSEWVFRGRAFITITDNYTVYMYIQNITKVSSARETFGLLQPLLKRQHYCTTLFISESSLKLRYLSEHLTLQKCSLQSHRILFMRLREIEEVLITFQATSWQLQLSKVHLHLNSIEKV